jgi:hypothetical protein
MFYQLKISIHDIKVQTPKVPKGALDHDLYILIRSIGLDHLTVPFLRWYIEYPFYSFTPPPLYRALVRPAK